ncbi:MAG: IS66 family transposase [Methylococcales bacterium]|nr:IS66 family transposase [Methylococcales bacterium]
MILKEHELLQMDEEFIYHLLGRDPDALAGLSIKLVNDLKEALERLNQNPTNSSRPSGSLAPWEKGINEEDDDWEKGDKEVIQAESVGPLNGFAATADAVAEATQPQTESEDQTKPRKPGRQKGAPGFGRTQKFEETDTVHHSCVFCSACQEDLATVEKAYTGFQTVNLDFGYTHAPGVRLIVTRHLYYLGLCPKCGLENRTEPWRAPADASDWKHVGLTEWRLIGPDLAALIVYLAMDMRVTRRKIKHFLGDVFGLQLSIGTLQNCIVESARAVEPVEAQLINDLCRESLVFADETSHPEARHKLWLWVFVTSSTALFLVGYRTKEIFTNFMDALTDFNGHLMSDGYRLYRAYLKRLRCWAHLLRKAKGLGESYTQQSQTYGQQVHAILNELINAVYQARRGPDGGTVSIAAHHQDSLAELKKVCEAMAASTHLKTRELGQEFLNDWEAIFRVLDYPAWPLTNNEAERALRHWVILRKISQGTRSPQGSRALALFASVFTTCRLRSSSPLLYLRDTIQRRRQGLTIPDLPLIPVIAAV